MKRVRFRMCKINVKQFAALMDSAPIGELSVGLRCDLGYSVETKRISILNDMSFKCGGEKFMLLTVMCEFEVNPDDWNSHIDGDVLRLPKDLFDCCLAQTVGVSRGVLHCKTEGTPFNHIVIPPLDVSKIVKENVEIPLERKND